MSEEEDDLADLIYRTSKTAKARADADEKKQKEMTASSASTGRRTSTRKRSSVSEDDGASIDHTRKKRAVSLNRRSHDGNQQARGGKYDWRKYAKICSADGCTNLARNGGVCIRHGAEVEKKRCSSEGCTNFAQIGGVCIRHGAKVKLCSSGGCTNQAVRKGVCWRHGGKRTPNDESTAFESQFDETTASMNLRHQSAERRTGVPGEVVICQ